MAFEVDAQGLCAREQQAQLLIEDEQCRPLAALDRREGDILQDSSDLPVPAGPRISVLDPRAIPPPSSVSSPAMPLDSASPANLVRCSAATSRGKTSHPAGADDEVVIAAAELLAAALDDPHAAVARRRIRRQLIEMDDAVRDAMDRACRWSRCQVVEQDDGRLCLREIMLQRQDLTAIAQRALRQQADFRQAVDHHSHGLEPFDRLENLAGGFAELEIRGIEQALLLLRSSTLSGGTSSKTSTRLSTSQPCDLAPSRSSFSVSARLT